MHSWGRRQRVGGGLGRKARGKGLRGLTYVDQSVDAAVLDHPPRILGGGEVRLSEERNIRKGVLVDKLDGPLDEPENELQEAVEAHAYETSLAGVRLVGHGA